MMECTQVQQLVWSDGPDAAPQGHLADCSFCAGEARKAGDLTAALRGLQQRMAVAPDGLETSLIASASRSKMERARHVIGQPGVRRAAAISVAAAGAAAAAAVGVIAARRRVQAA